MEPLDSEFLPDILDIYLGGDIEIAKGIVIHQPTIGEIFKFGENEFWQFVHTFCANTTSMRTILWGIGINWNKISDWEMFQMFMSIGFFQKEALDLVFVGSLDISKFKAIEISFDDESKEEETDSNKKSETKDGNKAIVFVNEDDPEIQINEEVYDKLMSYLRVMYSFNPKREFTKSKLTAQAIIEEEIANAKAQERVNKMKGKKPKWKPSILFPLMSALINHPGSNYRKKDLLDTPVFEFFDSLQRLRIYDNASQLGIGRFMLIDSSKIDMAKELDWAKDMYDN